MKPIGTVLYKDINGATDIEVTSVAYDLEALTIKAESSNGKATVKFESICGFRVLDEGDLNEFWPSFSSTSGRLFEVNSNGWMESESQRSDFISKHNEKIKEYFVRGIGDCVSILSLETPIIE